MKDVILRNAMAEHYICAAKKTFRPDVVYARSDSKSKFMIGHISDMHSDNIRFANAIDLFLYYKPDCVVHTGDVCYWNMIEDFKYLPNTFSQLPIPAYTCIGNHDVFTDAPGTLLKKHESGVYLRNENGPSLPNEYVHQVFIDEMKNVKGDEEKQGYFYVDFEDKGIRIIFLNDYQYYHEDTKKRDKYAILESQINWLIELLKDASDKDLGVVIADHEGPGNVIMGENAFCQRGVVHPWSPPPKKEDENPQIIADIVDAFKHAKALKKEYYYKPSEQTVNVDCNFEKEGEFICYLSGHYHADFVGYLETYPDQLSLQMPASCCDLPHYMNEVGELDSDLPRIPGTVSEDCINFYIIDRNKKTVSIVRAGACVNDEFEKRIFERLSY